MPIDNLEDVHQVDSGNGYSYSFTTTDWDQDTWDRVFGKISNRKTKVPVDKDATLNEVRDLLVEIRDEIKKDRQVVNQYTHYSTPGHAYGVVSEVLKKAVSVP